MPKIAAVADVHCHEHMRWQFAESIRDVNDRADVPVLAGDLTALAAGFPKPVSF